MDVNLVNYIKDLNNNFYQIEGYKNKNALSHFKFDDIQGIISSAKEIYFHDKNNVKTVLWDLFKNKRDVCRHLIRELTPNRSSGSSYYSSQYYGSSGTQKMPHNPLFEANYYNHNSPDEQSFSLHIKNVTIMQAFQLALYCAFGNIYYINSKDNKNPITSSNDKETSLDIIMGKIINNCLLVSSLFLSIFLRESYNETSHVFNPSKIFNLFQNTEYRTKTIGDAFKLLSSTDELKFIPTYIYKHFDDIRGQQHSSVTEKYIQQRLEKIWNDGFIEENSKNICKDNRNKECFSIYFKTHRTIFGYKEATLKPTDVGDIIIRILLYIDISCTGIYDNYKDQLNSAQTSTPKQVAQTFYTQQQPKTITWFNITVELKGGGRAISVKNILTSNGRMKLINKLRKEYNHIINNANNENNVKKLQQFKDNIIYFQKNVKEFS